MDVSPRRIAAIFTLALTFAATAPAQAIHPEVQKLADATRIKINASVFSQTVKDALLADVAKALNPRFTVDAQFSDLDRVTLNMGNSKIALDHLDAFLKTLAENPVLLPKLKKRFTDKANDGLTSLPHGYTDMMRNTTVWRDQFENYPRVIQGYLDFRRDVAASTKAPPALKANMDSKIQTSLDMMGESGTAVSWSQSLDADLNRYKSFLHVIDDVVAFENQVRAEAYAEWPALVTNTIKEAEDIRVNVGNPAFSLGRTHLASLQGSYKERRIVMATALEIPKAMKLNSRGFEDIALLRKVDDIMAINVQYHAGQFNPHGIRDILNQVKLRK